MEYSLVLTTFNDEFEIAGLLESISMQSAPPCEIIMSDGGSGDRTIEVAREYALDHNMPLRILESSHRLNYPEGLNRAIEHATTDIIAIAATGNTYEPQLYETLVNGLDEFQCDISGAPYRYHATNAFSESYIKLYDTSLTLQSNRPSNHGIVVRRSVFEKIGLFYEHFYRAGEDYEFFSIRAKKYGIRTHISSGSIILWHVATNYHEFYRNMDLYMISDMQMFPKKRVLSMHAEHLSAAALLFITLAAAIRSKSLTPIYFWLMYMVYLLTSSGCFEKGHTDCIPLKLFELTVRPYMFARNLKYLKNSYHVDPEKIRYLAP